MRQRISPATVIACAALFFSLGGAGMAATGYRITSLWQIAPKVRHALRGHDGLQGPRGISGLQGAPGQAGASPGPGTLTVVKVLLGNQQPTATIEARCPTGTYALDGGFTGSNDIVESSAFAEEQPQPDGWVVSAHLERQGDGSISAWARCVS